MPCRPAPVSGPLAAVPGLGPPVPPIGCNRFPSPPGPGTLAGAARPLRIPPFLLHRATPKLAAAPPPGVGPAPRSVAGPAWVAPVGAGPAPRRHGRSKPGPGRSGWRPARGDGDGERGQGRGPETAVINRLQLRRAAILQRYGPSRLARNIARGISCRQPAAGLELASASASRPASGSVAAAPGRAMRVGSVGAGGHLALWSLPRGDRAATISE